LGDLISRRPRLTVQARLPVPVYILLDGQKKFRRPLHLVNHDGFVQAREESGGGGFKYFPETESIDLLLSR
jgi:hypothetical protein